MAWLVVCSEALGAKMRGTKLVILHDVYMYAY